MGEVAEAAKSFITQLQDRIRALEAENAELRERCASDPWWWAYSEYVDEGWDGPYASREEAERAAADTVSDEDEPPEFSFRQASNPEGCAEIERLEAELAAYKSLLAESKKDSERLDWLTPRIGLLDVRSNDDGYSFGFDSISGDRTLYGDLRLAIDAARAAEDSADE